MHRLQIYTTKAMEGLKGLSHLLPDYRPLSATFAICVRATQALQLLGFFCSLCWGMTAWGPDHCSLYDLGAGFASAVVHRSHLHRLLLPCFLSSAFPQLLVSPRQVQWLCQMQLGFALEAALGSPLFVLVLALGGVQANAVAMASLRYEVVVGATSTVLGMLGSQLAWIVRAKGDVSLGEAGRYAVGVAVVWTTALWPHTSALATLTAFLSGFLLTYAFLPADSPLDNPHICFRFLSVTLWLLISLLVFIWLRSLSFEDCGAMQYFDREGFRFGAGEACKSFCREY